MMRSLEAGIDKHCAKFHQQICVIDEWVMTGMATHMSNKDQTSAFVKTIPKDCKNSELIIVKGIIEGDRSQFPILVGNAILRLSLSIETKDHGVSVAKCTIAISSSVSRQSSGKRP
jgi:hypothetical protein